VRPAWRICLVGIPPIENTRYSCEMQCRQLGPDGGWTHLLHLLGMEARTVPTPAPRVAGMVLSAAIAFKRPGVEAGAGFELQER
jgi:hypothetical protein